MKKKIVLASTLLGLIALTACSAGSQTSSPGSIDNAPTSTGSAVATSEASQSPAAQQTPTDNPESDQLKDKPQQIVALVTSLSNADLSKSVFDSISQDASTINVTMGEGMADYYNQSTDSVVRIIKQASTINGAEDGNKLTFTVDVYKAQSALYAGESKSQAVVRLNNEVTALSSSDEAALTKATIIYTLTIDESGTSGVLTMEEKTN